MKINFGCGDKKKPGYLNVDSSEKCKPDVVWDVRNTNYPKEWEGAELIEMDNLAEHLTRDELIDVLNECHRILKDGGKLWIKSPVISRAGFKEPYPMFDGVFGDPTHKSFFTERTFDYWDVNNSMKRWHLFGKDYGIQPFKMIEKKILKGQMVVLLEK